MPSRGEVTRPASRLTFKCCEMLGEVTAPRPTNPRSEVQHYNIRLQAPCGFDRRWAVACGGNSEAFPLEVGLCQLHQILLVADDEDILLMRLSAAMRSAFSLGCRASNSSS